MKSEIALKYATQKMHRDVRKRAAGAGSWIGTADAYLKTVAECGAGGYCPRLEGGETSAQAVDWQKLVKEAADKFVYHDPAMGVIESLGGDKFTQAVKDGKLVDAPARSIMVFSACFTSRRKDRDGDILEPKGCSVDLKMPLLWQHLPFEPIGKLMVLTGQSEKSINGQCAIADTPLGNDAATLVEFGGLRISHGFRPLEFEPLGEKDGPGWHVVKYEMMEVSLVSVPSNVDAVITAFSRGKLTHALAKSWAGGLHAKRPPMAPVGIDLKALGGVVHAAPAEDAPEGQKAPACGCGAKGAAAADPVNKASAGNGDAADLITKDYLTGSWEWIESRLASKAAAFLSMHGQGNKDGWTCLIGTFANEGVIMSCWYDGMTWNQRHYKAGWGMVDGEPNWVGDPVVVEVTTEVRDHARGLHNKMLQSDLSSLVKADDALLVSVKDGWVRWELLSGTDLVKAGRTLSRKNEDALSDAYEDCKSILDVADLPRTAKALAASASSKIKGVLDTARKECDDDEDEDDEEEDEKKGAASTGDKAAGGSLDFLEKPDLEELASSLFG